MSRFKDKIEKKFTKYDQPDVGVDITDPEIKDKEAEGIVGRVLSEEGPSKQSYGQIQEEKTPIEPMQSTFEAAVEESKDDPKAPKKAWDQLNRDISGVEKELTDIDKIQGERDSAKKNARLGALLKSLVNASAMLYAAKKGIQSDIRLTDPKLQDEIREIEREMDYKRNLLKDKLNILRRNRSEMQEEESAEQKAKQKEKETSEKRQAALDKETIQRQDKVIKDIRDATEGTLNRLRKLEGSDLRDELQKYNIDEGTAKKISGYGHIWNDPAKYSDIEKEIRKYHAKRYGLTPSTPEAPTKPKEPVSKKTITLIAPNGQSEKVLDTEKNRSLAAQKGMRIKE